MNRPNGKSRWLFAALGTMAMFVGLLVTYGRTHGSESTTVQQNAEDIAALQNHDLEMDRILMGIAQDVAVTKNDVKWIKNNLDLENNDE